ncbi:MAG: hypothetical protein C3F11_08670 [Methylocystaceae bacterium]|nr:MAG: hypothetical protein C3F11_08670 [Methylocystaceae bacterium]
MSHYIHFFTGQTPKQEVLINAALVRAVFWNETTRSSVLVFDDKYAVSVTATLKEVESKLLGASTADNGLSRTAR